MKFEQLEGENHVFSIEEKDMMISDHYRDKVHVTSALSKFLTEFLLYKLGSNPGSAWVNEGVKSQLLKIGASQWIHGRVRYRIVVEFCPDEPEPSPPSGLEEFRQ
ncbi:KGK domain-containing protein [Microcoleus sp. FACHB-68]|uniref:KGK domain-containing protein n=1 Tax=Microcoleus sp. FACHB-68 TaxID=2692826 RepID=UPI0016895486|nr:KGK domain-containing protein [Microcoleus sp. FACHB-68]MBD1937128.1 hypothetical protein [Microcoleus sp. FACHB-68]